MCFVLLTLISCRIRVRLADCQTMLAWGVQIGHAGHLSSGCALVDENQITDLSGRPGKMSIPIRFYYRIRELNF
jgi:hypothetical protein